MQGFDLAKRRDTSSIKAGPQEKEGKNECKCIYMFVFGSKNRTTEMVFQKGVYTTKSPLLHRMLKHLRNMLAC